MSVCIHRYGSARLSWRKLVCGRRGDGSDKNQGIRSLGRRPSNSPCSPNWLVEAQSFSATTSHSIHTMAASSTNLFVRGKVAVRVCDSLVWKVRKLWEVYEFGFCRSEIDGVQVLAGMSELQHATDHHFTLHATFQLLINGH